MPASSKTIRNIRAIAAVNGVAAFLHVVFWPLAFYRLTSMSVLPAFSVSAQGAEKIDHIVTAGIGIADLLWSVPFLAVGSYGLLRQSPIGWLGAQMANALWWYSYTFLIFRELAMGQFRPGTMLFLPFALFSLWSAGYLWKIRGIFWKEAETLAAGKCKRAN